MGILAQQLVDATTEGGRAFIGLSIVCFLFVAILFAFDKVRFRKEDEEQPGR